ncbi:MAG: DUF3179 domain-containing protein [Candidatus Eisenbacteria bacterium]|nr:DUF3179 domain-containing protein [Candidatus Eisenbacteria bacterium]
MDLAVVNSREIADSTLTLAPSGWTYEFTFVLYDYETESLWYPVADEGEAERFLCISGEYTGHKLEPMTGELKSWSEWVARHPETKILK